MRARGLILGTAILLVSTFAPAFSATVTNTDDSGAGSLRDAISAAAPGETIVFAASVTGTITAATELSVAQSLTIQGPGAAILTIAGGGTERVFNLTAGTLSISGVTIADGLTAGLGGGVLIATASTLLVSDCLFEGNQAANGGGIGVAAGGSLTVDECTFDTNTTTSVGGGAILNFGTADISNSTFVGNTAPVNGGAINTQASGTTTIVNCTFFDNTSLGLAGALSNIGTTSLSSSTAAANEGSSGSVIATGSANVTLDNNVFADNVATTPPGAINSGAIVVAGSNNVFFNNTVAGTADDTTGYGTANFILAPTQPLEPLADNGGPTQTMLPVVDGAAICAGDPLLLPAGLTRDQRGLPRTTVDGSTTCLDAGSVQLEPLIQTTEVPTLGTAGIAALIALLGLVAAIRLRQ